MSRFLSILLLASPPLYAQGTAPDVKKNPVSLLPNGSVLKNVLLPRYDKDRRLVGDLKAEKLTLVDKNLIQGENVLVQFYAKDGSKRGDVKLQNATFDQAGSMLNAEEPVEIKNDNLVARGSGLVYAFQTGRGFLNGPATTWISSPEISTSMHSSPITQTALLALCIAPSLSYAAPPPYVSDVELAEIRKEASSMQSRVDEVNAASQENLSQDVADAEAASETALSFVNASKIETVATEKPDAEAAPLEVEPGPNDTVIKCDGGMYFDAEEGVLVYLNNVSVADPRFALSGANELKVFFDKKKAPVKKEGDSEKKDDVSKPEGPGATFGDVRKLVATGAVRILQKGVDGKEPVEASGAILTYDVPSGEIIVSGGYPWVKQGKFYARAKQPNLTLRLLTDGSFSTEGNWEMGGNLNLKNR